MFSFYMSASWNNNMTIYPFWLLKIHLIMQDKFTNITENKAAHVLNVSDPSMGMYLPNINITIKIV